MEKKMPTYLNKFREPNLYEHTIENSDGTLKGYLRIKPSGVFWKPAGAREFYRASLDDFINWIKKLDDKCKSQTIIYIGNTLYFL